jgi:hypothetical protein
MNKMTLVFWDVTPYSLVQNEAEISSRHFLPQHMASKRRKINRPFLVNVSIRQTCLSNLTKCLHMLSFVSLQVTLFISPGHISIAAQLVEEQKEFSI